MSENNKNKLQNVKIIKYCVRSGTTPDLSLFNKRRHTKIESHILTLCSFQTQPGWGKMQLPKNFVKIVVQKYVYARNFTMTPSRHRITDAFELGLPAQVVPPHQVWQSYNARPQRKGADRHTHTHTDRRCILRCIFS